VRANLLTLFLYAALGIFFFLFPMNLIQVQGYSTTGTGAADFGNCADVFSFAVSGGLVTRYGPRIPLVVGPLTAATGFVSSRVPGVRVSYWTDSSAFIVLGFGMASQSLLSPQWYEFRRKDRSGARVGHIQRGRRVRAYLPWLSSGLRCVETSRRVVTVNLKGLTLFPPIQIPTRATASTPQPCDRVVNARAAPGTVLVDGTHNTVVRGATVIRHTKTRTMNGRKDPLQ